MPNRLANETSPYLAQHAENPVDWYPWGSEALERARREDKPILLSIGYAACHWCHVMAHESFENDETARLMNELFVNIKVDREERPDLDSIYMQATQAMTGHGGWPMTVFLTPDTVPFYTGTYFPPDDRHGMPSFRRVLQAVADAYRTRRGRRGGDGREDARAVREHHRADSLDRSTHRDDARSCLPGDRAALRRATRWLRGRAEISAGDVAGLPAALLAAHRHGLRARNGARPRSARWRAAASTIISAAAFIVMRWTRSGSCRTSRKCCTTTRCSSRLGVHLWQATRDPDVRRVTEETIDWVDARDDRARWRILLLARCRQRGPRRDVLRLDARRARSRVRRAMRRWHSPTGASRPRSRTSRASTSSTRRHERRASSPHAAACRRTTSPKPLSNARAVLLARRARRVRPGRDEKVLAAWNGLMLRAVAESARAFGRDDYRALAVRNGEFLLREMVRDGRVMRSHTAGVTRIAGYLEDHAAVALGFLDLYGLTFDDRWLDAARTHRRRDRRMVLGRRDRCVLRHRERPRAAADTRPATSPTTPFRPEHRSPSIFCCASAELLGDRTRHDRAMHVLESLSEPLARYASAFGHLLGAADMAVHGAVEVALAGDPAADDFRALADAVGAEYVPSLVIAGGATRSDAPVNIALMADKVPRDDRATAFVCRQYLCEEPVTDPTALSAQLAHASQIAPRNRRVAPAAWNRGPPPVVLLGMLIAQLVHYQSQRVVRFSRGDVDERRRVAPSIHVCRWRHERPLPGQIPRT